MPVTINISGDNAAQALQDLTALTSALIPSSTANPTETEVTKTTRARKTTVAKPVTPEVAEETDSTDTEPVDDSEPDTEEEEAPDDVKLRAAALKATERVGKVPVKALLDKYEVPNVTGLPKNKRVQFLKDLEGLK